LCPSDGATVVALACSEVNKDFDAVAKRHDKVKAEDQHAGSASQ